MTREAINNSIWTASLLLQLALIALVFLRGLARRIPTFTVLLIFYILRSLALFFLASRLTPPVYAQIYSILAILDLLLQLAVAIELDLRVFPSTVKPLRRLGMLLAVPALAFAATLLIAVSLPSNAPLPVDRLQVFDSLFLALLGTLALGKTISTYQRRVTLGLAVFGIVSIVTTIGRTFAALHRDIHRYVAWTYTASIAWLLIVAFWLITLLRNAP